MGILTTEERVTYALRELYQAYGYKRYKVSKFEEYDLYVQNRNFLASRQILTFTNTDGKLMALKPDVTLSIIKNTKPGDGMRKVYYTEQVYRATDVDYGFREITQTGLELIGDVDLYSVSEVVLLAAKSLEVISDRSILDLSHIGILSGVLAREDVSDTARTEILRAVGQKNAHELANIARREGISPEALESLVGLAGICGPADEALGRIASLPLPPSSFEALEELKGVVAMLDAAGAGGRVYLDFSIVNDMDYYNGVYFRGFVEGVPTGILAGGRYDNLLSKMGRPCGAIGFAVYLDQLEHMPREKDEFDVDRLLLYDESTDPALVMKEAARLVADGFTVRVQNRDDGGVTCREKRYACEGEAKKV